MNARYYGFGEKLKQSDEAGIEEQVRTIVLRVFPGAIAVTRAETSDDRKGTDWWIHYQDRPRESLDLKFRGEDWQNRGCDDIALETWSVVGKKEGWTLDETKRTDWVLHLWGDTGRFVIFPFLPLVAAFRRNCEQWCAKFEVVRQSSGSWQSECVYVPRSVIWEAISKVLGVISLQAAQTPEQAIKRLNEKKFEKLARRYSLTSMGYQQRLIACGDTLANAATALSAIRDMIANLREIDPSDKQGQRFKNAVREGLLSPVQEIYSRLTLDALHQAVTPREIPPQVTASRKPKKQSLRPVECIQSEIWEGTA